MTADQTPLSDVAEPLTIDLALHGGPVYAGRSQGEALRAHYALDAADEENRKIRLVIPKGTYTVVGGYFLGVFGPSIVKAGSVEAFWSRLSVEGEDFLVDSLQDHVRAALAIRLG